ncbi:unnamed protein product [Mucor hiemalis]
MDSEFPMNSEWVETPKLRKHNHFDILSPPSSPNISKRKKKKKRTISRSSSTSSSIRSPLSNEITVGEWDQAVPSTELNSLHILRNEDILQQEQAGRVEPEEPQPSSIDEQTSILQKDQTPENSQTASNNEQPPSVSQQPDETLQQISFQIT